MNSELIELPKELTILKDVTGIQLENLKNEISSFCNRVKKLKQHIEAVDDEQLNNLKDFIQVFILCLFSFSNKNIFKFDINDQTVSFCGHKRVGKKRKRFGLVEMSNRGLFLRGWLPIQAGRML